MKLGTLRTPLERPGGHPKLNYSKFHEQVPQAMQITQ